MDKVDKIWMDGKLINWDDAKVHVLSHSLHYGSGVFEGIRFYKTDKGPAVFRLKEHVERLFKSAKVFNMEIPHTKEQIEEAVKETIKVNKTDAGYIRPLVFYGYGKMGLNPEGADLHVMIAVWPWGSYLGDKAVSVKTSSFIRHHPKAVHTEAKVCGYYVNSIFASLEAKKEGYDEALMLDYEGNIAEGPGENLFIIKDGKIYTPGVGNILVGITRDSVMDIANHLGYDVVEKTLTLEDLKNADEAFFTGTAAEVTAIGKLDGKNLGNGDTGQITDKIRTTYLDVVQGKKEKYLDWLSFC
ncbi:branched-chain amino acid transaminase [Nanoarchaeota archaeon]